MNQAELLEWMLNRLDHLADIPKRDAVIEWLDLRICKARCTKSPRLQGRYLRIIQAWKERPADMLRTRLANPHVEQWYGAELRCRKAVFVRKRTERNDK